MHTAAPARDSVRRTARDLVADEIRERILSGEWEPGRRLVVPDIARLLDVSPTPAREALQLLEATGFVTTAAYRGAQVAELDADDCDEIYAMRAALERIAARRSTPRLTDDAIEAMSRHLEDMRAAADAGDARAFVEADRRLHRVHYEGDRETRLWQRIMSLRLTSERYTRFSYRYGRQTMSDSVHRHEALLDAVRARDADAAAAWIEETLEHVPALTRETIERRA